MKWRDGSLYDENEKAVGRVYSPDGMGKTWTAHVWGKSQQSGFSTKEAAMEYVEGNVKIAY